MWFPAAYEIVGAAPAEAVDVYGPATGISR